MFTILASLDKMLLEVQTTFDVQREVIDHFTNVRTVTEHMWDTVVVHPTMSSLDCDAPDSSTESCVALDGDKQHEAGWLI